MNFTIDERKFEATLKEKLGDQYKRALTIFQRFGEPKAMDLTQILVHATEQGKEAKIIAELEKHLKKTSLDRSDLEEINKTIEQLKDELGIQKPRSK